MVGRTRLSSIIGRDEFPLRSYGPSLGTAGEACATVTKQQKSYFYLFMFQHQLTQKYILNNARLAS
jgi:hypothetical protein